MKIRNNNNYIASNVLCPILTAQGVRYRSLKGIWNGQIAKSKKINKNKDIEYVDLPDGTQIKALGSWNGMGTFFKIKRIVRKKWNGKVVKIKQKFGSIIITPDSNLFDVNYKKCKPEEKKWLLSVRKLNYEPNKYKDKIDLKLSGVYCSDKDWFWLEERGRIGKVKKTLSGEELDLFCKFVGFYIAEGCASYNKKTDTYWTIVSNTDREYLEIMKKELTSFLDCDIYISVCRKEEHKDCYNLQIRSRAFYSLMKKICGSTCYTKKIPSWFTSLRKDKLKIILEHLIEGDGCYTSWGILRYGTVSYELACQFCLLLTILGIDYTTREDFSTKDEIRNIFTKVWHIRECRSYQANQGEIGKKVEYLDYDGYVYSLSVDGINNFSAGTGNIVVCDNKIE